MINNQGAGLRLCCSQTTEEVLLRQGPYGPQHEKTVFRVSDQVIPKPACSTTVTYTRNIAISLVASLDIYDTFQQDLANNCCAG